MNNKTKPLAVLIAAMLAAALLAACGSDDNSSTAKAGNATDVAFITDMVPHHEGAVAMAEEAKSRAEHAQIRTMANSIISAQQSEIDTLNQIGGDLHHQGIHGGSPAPGRHASAAATADETHTKPAAMRKLMVFRGAEPAPSARGAVMRALRVTGQIPAHAVIATVLSDEDCAPDSAGVSHCRNMVRLPNGNVLTLRHPHRMSDVPCMTPGERVRVRRAT